MKDTLKLSIVTPNGLIFEDEILSVVVPGIDGEFCVLPHHSSLVSTLDVGVIEIAKKDSTKDGIAINWGYIKVDEKYVKILVEGAVSLNPDDDSTIAHKIQEAKELVSSVKDSNTSIDIVTSKISTYH